MKNEIRADWLSFTGERERKSLKKVTEFWFERLAEESED